MKCRDAREYLAEISEKSITSQIPPADLDFLSSYGYVLRSSKADRDRAAAEVAGLAQINERVVQERAQTLEAQQAVEEDKKKTHGFIFGLHGEAYKNAMRQKLEADEAALNQDNLILTEDETKVSDFIQKKSALDQLVPYGNEYLSLSGSGVAMLNALNSRMARISELEFSDYIREMNETDTELRGIAERANRFVSDARNRIALPDEGQV